MDVKRIVIILYYILSNKTMFASWNTATSAGGHNVLYSQSEFTQENSNEPIDLILQNAKLA